MGSLFLTLIVLWYSRLGCPCLYIKIHQEQMIQPKIPFRSIEGLELSHLRVCSGLFRAFGLGHLHCIRINKVFLLTALYKAILLQYNILYNCTHRNVKREKLHSQCILLDRIQSNVIRQILTFEGRYLIWLKIRL